jgi:hypothetical protein
MAASATSKLFSTEDCKIAELLSDPPLGTAVYATPIDVPGIRKASMTPQIESKQLRGDNRELDNDSTLVAVEIQAEHAKISYPVLAVLLGGTWDASTGYSRLGSDYPKPFRIEWRTPDRRRRRRGRRRALQRLQVQGDGPYQLGTEFEDYQILSFTAPRRLPPERRQDLAHQAERDGCGHRHRLGVTTEADRLLAAGVPLRGVDGEVRLRFTMLALKRCEDVYGSLGAMITEHRWLNEQFLKGWPEPAMDRVLTLVRTVAGGPVGDLAETPSACLDAVNSAWFEAFPPSDEAVGKAEGAETPPGHGQSSGDEPASSST